MIGPCVLQKIQILNCHLELLILSNIFSNWNQSPIYLDLVGRYVVNSSLFLSWLGCTLKASCSLLTRMSCHLSYLTYRWWNDKMFFEHVN
jgi:hypothetical protein